MDALIRPAVRFPEPLGRRRWVSDSTLVSLVDLPILQNPHCVSVAANVVGRPLESWDGILFGAIIIVEPTSGDGTLGRREAATSLDDL